MTLNSFLLLIIILIPLLLLLCYKREYRWSKKPLTYIVVISLAMIASYWTFTHYAKSRGGYYKNTEYHLIQQDGFRYTNGLLKLTSDIAPEKAILETGIGELEMDGSGALSSDNFKLPLYVQERGNDYRIVNLFDELSMDNGESLIIMGGRDTLLNIKYEELNSGEKNNRYRFSFNIRDGVADTVEKTKFEQGYNLGELLQEGNYTRLSPDLQDRFQFCYLVRDHYELDLNKREKYRGKVYLFVPDDIANELSFFKNGTQVGAGQSRNITGISLNGKHFFYGLGKSKSDVFKVHADSTGVKVTYRLPRMYHFPEGEDVTPGEAKMFLTTDKQEIIDRRGDFLCYYQFSEQLADNSIYKVAAVLNFIIDSAGTSINPQLGDLNSDFNQSALSPITVNKPFEVQTLSCRVPENGVAQVSYLFTIRDMRDNEVYNNALWLYLVMMLLFGIIYAMLYLFHEEDALRINRLYILETSVYLVLIAFLTVRLVLLWRLHTFPPIENVSKMEWDSLVRPDYFWWTFWAIVAILVFRIAIIVAQKLLADKTIFNLNDWLGNWLDDLFDGNWTIGRFAIRKWIVGITLPIVVCVCCALLGNIIKEFEVISKEAIAPLLIFAINSLYYVQRVRLGELERGDKRGLYCWLLIIWNMLIYLFFLAIPSRFFIGFGENGMIVPMVGVFAAWILIVIGLLSKNSMHKGKVVVGVVCGLLLVAIFCHLPLAKTDFGMKFMSSIPEEFSRPASRVITLCQTPNEMVQNQNVRFGEKHLQDILNASSNKWFIDGHLAQRYYIENKIDKSGFVLDKEYNQNAVSYTTQTRDVVLLRYIIYEHGRGMAIQLVVILLLLAASVYTLYSRKKDEMPYMQLLPIHASLFLLIYSAYLLLVNMNAVVFIGLDFPFLSLCSGAAPFGLPLPLLAILIPANITHIDDYMSADSNDKEKLGTGALVAAFMLILAIVPAVVTRNIVKNNDGKSSATFSISMAPLAEFINDYMNPQLDEYQENNDTFRRKKVNDPSLKKELNVFVFDSTGHNSRIDVALKEFAQNPAHQKDVIFIRSAFERLFKTSLTNTNSLIHIRKANGKFCFVTNKVYYDMKPLFNNDKRSQWYGDLLGAAGASSISFVGENRKETIMMKRGFYEYGCAKDVENEQKLKKQFLGTISKDDPRISFNIVQIPKKYCYALETGDRDVYIIRPTDAPVSIPYVVYPLGDATNPIKASNIALWIRPNDIVKIKGCKQSFSFKTEDGHFFSKRIHYNGKHQPIYPMGDRFMFAYNFDQMLANCYHPDSNKYQPIRISLDYELHNAVYNYCDSVMRNKSAFGQGVTVTAVDGNGRIRLLADYNPQKTKSADPNKDKELRKRMEEIYLEGNKSEEQILLKNRNICRLLIGPGSTIKVPFFVATAAGSYLNWNNLSVRFPAGQFVKTDGDVNIVTNYGSYVTDGIHKKNGWDEMIGEYRTGETMGASRFITKSNNYFFGAMIGLATYDPNSFANGMDNVLESVRPNESVFPLFVYNNHYYKFKDNFIDDFRNSRINSRILENSLTDNFHFLRWLNRDSDKKAFDIATTDFLFRKDTMQSLSTRLNTLNSEYIYSAKPTVHRDIKNTSDADVIKDIFHLTSGGAKRLDVSPLNMAEMYLRITQLNRADNILTYNDEATAVPYEAMIGNTDNFATQMQNTTFLGMWNVMSADGTLNNYTDINYQKALANRNSPIYLYGKTGTVNAKGMEVDGVKQVHDNKHYAFILSNKRLDHSTNLDGLKVYVVYFGFYNTSLGKGHSSTSATRKALMELIINSETFQNYWNN